jgi:hypothetical protein
MGAPVITLARKQGAQNEHLYPPFCGKLLILKAIFTISGAGGRKHDGAALSHHHFETADEQ